MDSIFPDTPQKQCTRCKELFPATKEHFYSHKVSRDGLTSFCKSCVNIMNQEYKLNPRYPKPPISDGNKYCSKCKQVKPATLEYFAYSKRMRDRLAYRCKVCANAKFKTHYPTDVPQGYKRCTKCKKDLPATSDYFGPNKHGKYGLASRCRSCIKIIYDEHKEERRRYDKKRWEQPSRKAQHRTVSLNYLVRKKEVQGIHTIEQIQEQLKRQKYRCYYAACGFSKFERTKENDEWKYIFHVEHTFPLVRVAGTDIPANDMDYLVLSCKSCNESKGNKYPWEWIEGGRLL